MQKIKNKKYKISKTEVVISNILKISAAIAFLYFWLPIVLYVSQEVIKLYIK